MGSLYRYWLIFDVTVGLLLSVAFGFLYITNHAWGSWGDDSPGYIYTAGQLLHGENLVSQDPLVRAAMLHFESEPQSRFVAPTHHEIISPDGWIASRYPIGLGALMYFVSAIFKNDELIYVVVPVLAVGVVILTYILALLLADTNPAYKRVIGIMSAVSVGLANLFANYAVSQPMREIPSMFFFMLAFIAILISLRETQARWLTWSSLILGGLAYGYSVNIRETSGVLLLPILILFFYGVKKVDYKRYIKLFSIFMVAVILAGSLSIWNSVMITAHKEKFREKDISSIAITSNFDHVRSLNFQNLYNNQGKFRPGVGGVNQYWSIMQQFSNWPPFLFMALVGLGLLWSKHRRFAIFLGTWFLTIFLLFSAWINPYPRYILPLLPAVAIASSIGTIASLQLLKKYFALTRTLWSIVAIALVGSFFVTLQPSLADRQQHITEDEHVYKALTYQDLEQTRTLAKTVTESQSTQKPALLLMLGEWKAGMSEMVMTHATVRSIRFPRKDKERPPMDTFLDFLKQLNETNELYLWYDASANADEQKLRTLLNLEPIATYDFSFQSGVELYKITY